MSFRGIALYSLRAALFAGIVCAAWALVCRLRGRAISRRRLLEIGYLAALVQITVLRGGVNWPALADAPRSLQLVPLRTVLAARREGWWQFIYHTLGNLLWFLPLGIMLRRRPAVLALLAGAGLSLAIEVSQFILATGASDVDDVLLNALGALLGWALARIVLKKRPSRKG